MFVTNIRAITHAYEFKITAPSINFIDGALKKKLCFRRDVHIFDKLMSAI